MRILVAGSRDFFAGYRIDRALVRASKDHYSSDMTLVSLGRRTRRGADQTAREIADALGWELDRAEHVSEARADVCLAFLHLQDPPDDKSRITAMKAEKAGIPVWRYYEGRAAAPTATPEAWVPPMDVFGEDPWEVPAVPVSGRLGVMATEEEPQIPTVNVTLTPNGNGTFTIEWEPMAS